jgi:hypothetical protein
MLKNKIRIGGVKIGEALMTTLQEHLYQTGYIPLIFSYSSYVLQAHWLLAIGEKKVLCLTNIGKFLKNATDCNFFSKYFQSNLFKRLKE